jgi:hypothetical protein
MVILGGIEYWGSSESRGLDIFIIGMISKFFRKLLLSLCYSFLLVLLPGGYGMTIVVAHLLGRFGYDAGFLTLYD